MLQKCFLHYCNVRNSIPRKKGFKTSKSNRSEITCSQPVSVRSTNIATIAETFLQKGLCYTDFILFHGNKQQLIHAISPLSKRNRLFLFHKQI